MSKKKCRGLITIKYTAMFFVTALIAFCYFIILNKTFIWEVDGFLQHYPLLVKLKQIVYDLCINHCFDFWSDDISIGADTIGNLGYVLTDPFCYIAIIFPVKYLDLGYSVACILRMYVAGLAMLAYLKYKKMSDTQVLVGSLSYALSYWAIGAINHGFFLLPLIWLPLIILGVDRVFDGKSPAILIISVALQFITLLYFAYMTGLYVLFYMVVKLVFEKDRYCSAKEKISLISRFVFYVLVSMMISMPVLVPALIALINASKSAGVINSWLPTVKELLNYFPTMIDGGDLFGNYSYYGISALLVVLLPLVITRGMKRNKVSAIMCFFGLIMVVVPLFGMIMNAFSYRVGRFCYAVTFFFIYATTEQIETVKEITDKEKKIIISWIISLTSACVVFRVISKPLSSEYLIVAFWNILCMFIYYYFCICDSKKTLAVLTINIGVSYMLIFSPSCVDRIDSFLDQGWAYEAYSSSLMKEYKEIESTDNDFFRVDYNEHVTNQITKYSSAATTANENLFWNSRALSGYLSTFTQDYLDFNNQLLNSADNYRRTCNYSNDNRARLNYLLGVKYYIYDQEGIDGNSYAGYAFNDYKDSSDSIVLKSEYNPGLGYVYSNVVSEEELENFSPLEQEQIMFQNVVVEDVSQTVISEKNLDSKVENVNYSINSEVMDSSNSFTVTNSPITLKIDTSEIKNSEVYVYVENLRRRPFDDDEWLKISRSDLLLNSKHETFKYKLSQLSSVKYSNYEYTVSNGSVSKRVIMTDGDAQGFSDVNSFLTNLGYCKSGENSISLYFKNQGEYTFDSIKIYAVPIDGFKKTANYLENNRFTVDNYTADSISGHVTANKEGVLFFSILYNPGWKVYIDGEKVDTFKVDYCFTGVNIGKGVHTVELSYKPVFFDYCIILSIIGIVLLVALKMFYRKNVIMNAQKENEND